MSIKKNKYSKLLKLIAKIALSLFALYFVFSRISFIKIFDAIQNINFFYLFMSVLIYALSQVVSSYRLMVFYKYLNIKINFYDNIKLYWLGLFYNFLLPGGVGGDGYKVFLLNKQFKTKVTNLVGTIFADRLSGLAVIVIYILALIYLVDYDFESIEMPSFGFEILHDFLVYFAPYFKYLVYFIPLVVFFYYLYLKLFSSRLKKSSFKVLFLSVIIQGLQMLAALIILVALDTKLSGLIDNYMLLFLLSSIMSAIPISLGGLGLRELTFMVGSAYLEVNSNNAVALSIVFYAVSLFVATFGIYYVFNVKKVFVNSEK